MLAAVLAVAMMAAVTPVRAGAGSPAQDKKPPQVMFDIPPISERIEIDGSKNPEMIPQWDVWQAAFEIDGAKSDLPTDLVEHLSKEEVELLLAAAKENAENFQVACQQRVLQARAHAAKRRKRRYQRTNPGDQPRVSLADTCVFAIGSSEAWAHWVRQP